MTSTPTRRGATPPLSIAPMMARTDRHYRYFMRQITRRTLLYTEMVTTGAVLHGDRAHLLGFHPDEHPIALQLGGDDPAALARCAAIGAEWGYDEINLNVGCPSDRVQNGNFGACLMLRPERVAECVAAMRAVTDRPITVKHRIGVDDLDRYEDMLRFVEIVAAAGADRFTVHARKAWLSGLSPKENREIPPLRYDEVYRLKRELPHLAIEINGGIEELDQAAEHLQHVDAAMLGRAPYARPWLFAEADRRFFADDHPIPTRHAVVRALVPYAAEYIASGGRLIHLSRHLVTLFVGVRGTKPWKQHLSTFAPREGATAQVLLDALAHVPEEDTHADAA